VQVRQGRKYFLLGDKIDPYADENISMTRWQAIYLG
jgi:hypothetical protein